jgi:hypothetical protein
MGSGFRLEFVAGTTAYSTNATWTSAREASG